MTNRVAVGMRVVVALYLTLCGVTVRAETEGEPATLSRVFFQDDEAKTIRWADLHAGSPPKLGAVSELSGFPKLDPDSQSLVQMESAGGMLLVGVRDDEDGSKKSGWVLIDSGVESEPHDGHTDYDYAKQPKVRAICLDDKQGNPAHLYVYDQVFYLANDKRAGYTRIDPAELKPADEEQAIISKARFIAGGGGHITLAAVGNKVGYSTWIDRAGENQGRVDVTPLSEQSNGRITYSFCLPHGGIHGATANSGKLFFAPADGICWVHADLEAAQDPEQIAVQHVSLGKHPLSDKPIRTGAFTNLGKQVLFVTGEGPTAALQMIDATDDAPAPHKLSLDLADGARPVGPAAGHMVGNFPMALVFHDHPAESDAEHRVSLIELDPNMDGDYVDAKVGKVLKVGKSKVDGHAGHHAAAFLPDRRHAVFTNPGDGTLGILRVRRLELVTELRVGGVPSKIEAVGGPSGH